MAGRCNERGLSLGSLALQFAMKHDAVGTCIMGCRTPEEVHGVCDAARLGRCDTAPLPP